MFLKFGLSDQKSRSGFMILMLIAFASIILGLSVTFYSYCKRGLDDSAVAVKLANQRLALSAALAYITNACGAAGINAPVDETPTVPADWSTPSNWGNATYAVPSPTNPFNPSKSDTAPAYIISLQVKSSSDSSLGRSSKQGWFRVSYPFIYTANSQKAKDLSYYFETTGIAGSPKIADSLPAATKIRISNPVQPVQPAPPALPVPAVSPILLQNCVLLAVGCGPSQGSFSSTTAWENELVNWYLVELHPRKADPANPGTPGKIKSVTPLFPPPQNSTPTQDTPPPAAPFYW